METPIAKLIHFEKSELEVFEKFLPEHISLAEAIRMLVQEDNKKNEKPSQDFSPLSYTNLNFTPRYKMIMDEGIPDLYADFREWRQWANSLDLEEARNFHAQTRKLDSLAHAMEATQLAKKRNTEWKKDLIDSIVKNMKRKTKRYDGLNIQTPSDVTTAFDPTREEIVEDDEIVK
jgi:hypothetical protein